MTWPSMPCTSATWVMRRGPSRSRVRCATRARAVAACSRAALRREDMVLVELQLLGILDGDDAFLVGDERRQHVQGGRLTGAGSAGHDDVQPSGDAGFEEPGRGRVEGAEADEVLDLEGVL